MRSVVLALILACAHAPIAPPHAAQLPSRQRDPVRLRGGGIFVARISRAR